jgi:hypothetical protein
LTIRGSARCGTLRDIRNGSMSDGVIPNALRKFKTNSAFNEIHFAQNMSEIEIRQAKND